MKRVFAFFSLVLAALFFLSFQQSPSDWVVPEKYQKMKNPVPLDATSIKIGKDMYTRHCKSCHGVNGKGNGPKAEKLKPSPGDFTTAAFSKVTDGAIFYKMTVGHDNMPSFKKRIPSNDDVIEGSFGHAGSVGDLINYIRTFGPK